VPSKCDQERAELLDVYRPDAAEVAGKVFVLERHD
jgi:hypothetical protein